MLPCGTITTSCILFVSICRVHETDSKRLIEDTSWTKAVRFFQAFWSSNQDSYLYATMFDLSNLFLFSGAMVQLVFLTSDSSC